MMSANLKELYSSANGDVWFLERAPDGLFVIHEPNKSSGGTDPEAQRKNSPEEAVRDRK